MGITGNVKLDINELVDRIILLIGNWRLGKKLEKKRADIKLFASTCILVTAVEELYLSLRIILSEFLDFDSNWDPDQRQRVINTIKDHFNTRVRIDLISGSTDYLEEIRHEYNDEKGTIIDELVRHGKEVLIAFKAEQDYTIWNFRMLSDFFARIKNAETIDDANKVKEAAISELDTRKNNDYPRIAKPKDTLRAKILFKNDDFTPYFVELEKQTKEEVKNIIAKENERLRKQNST